MDFFFLSGTEERFPSGQTVRMTVIWIFGLFSGIFTASCSGDLLRDLFLTSFRCVPTFVSLLSVISFPLLLICVCVLLNWRTAISAVLFLKAFLLAYHSMALGLCFPAAGWLLGCMLLFSDFVSSVCLWLFWLRSQNCNPRDTLFRLIPLAAVFLLICWVDCSLIAPFLGAVIS